MADTLEIYPSHPSFDPIERFHKKYFFLSNMFEVISGIETPVGLVPTTEHAYQLSKFTDESAQTYVALGRTGLTAKDRAYELQAAGVPVRPDWETDRLEFMYNYNNQKFVRNPKLGLRLLATGAREIIEGNNHGDQFWGVSPPFSREGQNQLGKILMRIRDELLEAL